MQWADGLRGKPVLLVEADDQNHADMEALPGALRKTGVVALNQLAVALVAPDQVRVLASAPRSMTAQSWGRRNNADLEGSMNTTVKSPCRR